MAPQPVLAGPMLVVAAAGLTVNVTGMWLLRAGPGASLNVKGAYLEVLSIPRTWVLPRQAVNIMLEGTPPHLDLAKLERAMASVPGVQQVHDFPVWTLTSGKEVMSGHVVAGNLGAGDQILRDLHTLLHDRFAVEHTTIQLESRPLVHIVIREVTASAADGAGEARPS